MVGGREGQGSRLTPVTNVGMKIDSGLRCYGSISGSYPDGEGSTPSEPTVCPASIVEEHSASNAKTEVRFLSGVLFAFVT